MIADELRRQADEFVDIAHLMGRIGRDVSERNERPERVERQARFADRRNVVPSQATSDEGQGT